MFSGNRRLRAECGISVGWLYDYVVGPGVSDHQANEHTQKTHLL